MEEAFDDVLVLDRSLGGMDYALYLAIKYYLTDFSYPRDATEDDRKRLRIRSRGYFLKDDDCSLSINKLVSRTVFFLEIAMG